MLSDYLLDELRRVLPKLDHRHGLGANDIDDFADALAIQAELVEPVAIDAALKHDRRMPVLARAYGQCEKNLFAKAR